VLAVGIPVAVWLSCVTIRRPSAWLEGSTMLRCEECGRESDWEDVYAHHVGDPRWKAYLTIDSEAVI
jgi:hypothetical protein